MKEILFANPTVLQTCVFAFSAVAAAAGVTLKHVEHKRKRTYQLTKAKNRLKVFRY